MKTLNVKRTRRAGKDSNAGLRKEEKLLKIEVKQGWKDGTKLTFEANHELTLAPHAASSRSLCLAATLLSSQRSCLRPGRGG